MTSKAGRRLGSLDLLKDWHWKQVMKAPGQMRRQDERQTTHGTIRRHTGILGLTLRTHVHGPGQSERMDPERHVGGETRRKAHGDHVAEVGSLFGWRNALLGEPVVKVVGIEADTEGAFGLFGELSADVDFGDEGEGGNAGLFEWNVQDKAGIASTEGAHENDNFAGSVLGLVAEGLGGDLEGVLEREFAALRGPFDGDLIGEGFEGEFVGEAVGGEWRENLGFAVASDDESEMAQWILIVVLG